MLVVVLLATLPPGAPLRDPDTGDIVGNTPFMDSLLFIIAAFFLVAGICYGAGAGTINGSDDVIAGITKTFSSLGGLVLMFLMIAQFLAYFNYSNLPQVIAVALADLLERAAIPALPLLIAVHPGHRPARLHPARRHPEVGHLRADLHPHLHPAGRWTADRARRLSRRRLAGQHAHAADGVLPVHRHRGPAVSKGCRRGTIVAIMLPYAVIMLIAWIVLFAIWYVLNIPLGPGYCPRSSSSARQLSSWQSVRHSPRRFPTHVS